MLSERQKALIVRKVNEDIDLPLLREKTEAKIIAKLLDLISPVLEPALGVLMAEQYVGCIKVGLNEDMSVDDRAAHISNVMRNDLQDPLARELDQRVDSRAIPSRLEAALFRSVSKEIIDASVEWTVGKVDEKLQNLPLSRDAPPEGMLNQRQRHKAIQRVNESLNLPFLSESQEERILEKVFDRILPHLEPSLGMIMSETWLHCIKIALNEALSVRERRDQISKMVRGELSAPLSRELNSRVDVKHIPEKYEGKIFSLLTNKILDEVVEWTVCKIDDKLSGDADA